MTSFGVAFHDWAGETSMSGDLKKFDRVYLCVEDRHVLYRKELVTTAVKNLHGAGLEVWADPWGVGGKFAGETVGSSDPYAVDYWLSHMLTVPHLSGILWDEPKSEVPHEEFMDWVTRCEQALMPHELAIQPERRDSGYMAWADNVSISTYLFPPRINNMNRDDVSQQIDIWDMTIPKGDKVWVQTWNIGEGLEWMPGFMIREWAKRGRDINVWSYMATRHIDGIRPANPKEVWTEVMNAIDWAKRTV